MSIRQTQLRGFLAPKNTKKLSSQNIDSTQQPVGEDCLAKKGKYSFSKYTSIRDKNKLENSKKN